MEQAETQLERQRTIRYLLGWIITAGLAGSAGGAIARGFATGIIWLGMLPGAIGFPPWAFPVMGAVVNALLIFSLFRSSVDEGTASYIRGVRSHFGILPASQTIGIGLAGLVTVGTLGIAGGISPASRFAAGACSDLTRRLQRVGLVRRYQIRTAAIAGFAGAAGALTGAPIGSGIFAVEVLDRSSMRYRDLFPAIIAGAFGTTVSRPLGGPLLLAPAAVLAGFPDLSLSLLGLSVAVAVLAGLLGRLYGESYRLASLVARRRNLGTIRIAMIGSTVISSGLVFVLAPWLPGQLASLLPTVAAPGTHLVSAGGPITSLSPAFALVLSVVVLIASALTVGGGMAGGFTTPSIAAGALLGLAAAGFLGLQPGDPLLVAAVVAGIGGLLSSSANVPIATAVLITEVLGPGYGVVSALAATIGFQINRHHMIYDYIIEDLDTED